MSWSFAEKALTEIFKIIISIVLARILLPNDFGTVAIIEVFVSIFSIFVMFGFGTSLVQKKNPTEEDYRVMFYSNALIGIILYLILFFASPFISSFYNNNSLCILLRVLGIKLPLGSVYSIQEARIQKRMEFKKFFFSSLAGTIIGGTVGIVLAVNGAGVWALVAYPLVDQAIDSLVLFFITRWFPKPIISISSIKKCGPMYKYGSRILASELIGRMSDHIRMLAIGKVYSSEDLAYNSKGQKFPQVLIDTIDTTVIRVMFPELSRRQESKESVVEVSRKTIQVCSFLLAPLVAGMIATANIFVPLVYGTHWVDCVPYVQLYCVAFVFNPIQLINIKMIQASGRSDITLKTQIIKVFLSLSIIFLTLLLFKNPISIVVSYIIYMFITLFINSFPCKKLFGYGLFSEIRDVFSSLLLAAVMGGIVYLFGFMQIPLLVCFVIQVLVGGVIYFSMSWFFKIKPFMYLLSFIKTKINRGKCDDNNKN